MPLTVLSQLSDPAICRRLVLKVGSSLLVDRQGKARRTWLASLAQDIAALRTGGTEVIVVSSGAIALGAARLDLPERGRRSLADAQAAAAVGQIALAGLWTDCLAGHGIPAAQLLLTLSDLEDRRRYLNVAATLARLLEAGAVPVINENDSVATEEIRFGDNDRLAARVAQAAQVDAVVLLSDVDGLYDRDPREAGAALVPIVDGITAEILAMASSASSSGLGSGGMASKLQAAQIAERAGIALAIINGTQDAPLATALTSARGTLFRPQRSDRPRKAWLGGRMAAAGTVRVDAGCAEALMRGASLLAAGVVGISGSFRRGDLIRICDLRGKALAQGLSEYDSAECMAIAGKRDSEQADLLGYAPRSCLVHRDHMVLL
ncbi:MAG: glutamate 5-kinase [Sphingomonadaceae bacterium]